MKKLYPSLFLVCLLLFYFNSVNAQDEQRAAWQVSRFDISADASSGRVLKVTETVTLRNVGRGAGTTLTVRLSPKAKVTAVKAGNAALSPRSTPEQRGDLQRVFVSLPGSVPPDGTIDVTFDYSIEVESNTGISGISPVGAVFLPASSWYAQPNTQFSLRGADTAPVRISVTPPAGLDVVSSGKLSGRTFEQTVDAQPFFVAGAWDTIEGTGDAVGITAYVEKGASAEERKHAQDLIVFAQSARAYFSTILGTAPAVPIRLVSVSRGAGFSDGGTLLLDDSAFRREKLDSQTAVQIADAVARLWVGGAVSIRGEGSGAVREGLSRHLATKCIEERFGPDAGNAERNRQRIAFSVVARRDAPLAITTPLDDTYFTSVLNKGALVWRLVESVMGKDAFAQVLRAQFQSSATTRGTVTLQSLRASLVERGGEPVKAVLDAMLDQPSDLDLLAGLPVQKGGQSVVALRNTGSIEATVNVAATTERGESLKVSVKIPSKSFSEAAFSTPARLVRAEVDPEKVYPQLDYSNDMSPKVATAEAGLTEASSLFSRQDNARAETLARDVLRQNPKSQEARIILGRALAAQGKSDEAEKELKAVLAENLPTPATLAWANVGLGEIYLKKGQAREAANYFDVAAKADAEYASTLAARSGRVKAEAAAGGAPVDQSAATFVGQLDQAIKAGRKADLENLIVSGELVNFVKGIVGSQPEVWQSKVLRSEPLSSNEMALDVTINARELGKDQSGTAVFLISKVGGAWKLEGIEFFEVR